MPHLQKRIHTQKRQRKILLTQMQKRRQTQSRQGIHTQMETISLRSHRIQGRLPKMGATQPRGSRRDSCTQSQSGSRRQCDTRPHPSQMGGQQRNLLSLRRIHQSRPQVARPYVADSGTQSPDSARRATRHRQHRLRPSSLQQQQGRSNHRGVHGATEARQLGHFNPLAATQQGYEGVTSLLKPAQDAGAIHA